MSDDICEPQIKELRIQTDIEATSAAVLRDIIARGEATDYLARIGKLAGIVLLARAMRRTEREYKAVFAGDCDMAEVQNAYMLRYAAAYDALVTALDALAADLDTALGPEVKVT